MYNIIIPYMNRSPGKPGTFCLYWSTQYPRRKQTVLVRWMAECADKTDARSYNSRLS